jgi:hypothetical protein
MYINLFIFALTTIIFDTVCSRQYYELGIDERVNQLTAGGENRRARKDG